MKVFLRAVGFSLCLYAALLGLAQAQNTAKLDMTLFSDNTHTPNAKFNFSLQGYTAIDFRHLTQLYFKAGVLRTDNNDAISEYLAVSECKLYADTHKDDFMWPDVHKATAKYIEKYKRGFTSLFTLVQPIAFERYDPGKEWFSLTADTQYINATSMVIAEYPMIETPCGTILYPRAMPTRATIKIGHPFSLTNLKMPADLARNYLDYMAKRPKKAEILGVPRERYAYIKFFLKITGFDATKTSKSSVAFLGDIDGYIIFADQSETLPLHTWINPRLNKDPNLEDGQENMPQVAPDVTGGIPEFGKN